MDNSNKLNLGYTKETEIFNKNYILYKQVKELEFKKGAHTELITLYIAHKKNLSDVINNLKIEKNESSNIKDKTNRDKVVTAIEKIMYAIKHAPASDTGYCIFGDAHSVSTIVPPRQNNLNKYFCNKFYDTTHLKRLIVDEVGVYGLVVVDGNETTIGRLEGDKFTILEEFDSEVKNRTIKGGQSARRYRNAREESVNFYFSEISLAINKHFSSNTSKIYYGGIIPASEEYLKKMPDLQPVLKNKFSECYPIPFADRMGIRCLLEKVKQNVSLEQYERGLQYKNTIENLVKSGYETTVEDPSLSRILLAETKILEVEFSESILNRINIEVCELGTPLYEYLIDLYGGILYLK